MWDWYTRPGGHGRPPARVVALILLVAGLIAGAVLMLLSLLLTPMFYPGGLR
jgi:hypothetical protein